MVGGFCWCLLLLFVPETFWDRTPRPKNHQPRSRSASRMSFFRNKKDPRAAEPTEGTDIVGEGLVSPVRPDATRRPSSIYRPTHGFRVEFAEDEPQHVDIKSNEPSDVDNAQLSPAAGTDASPPAAHIETQHSSGNIYVQLRELFN